MFKKSFIVLLLILLCSSVFSLRLIEPLSKTVVEGDNFVGTVAVGNTIEMIFSKELTDEYDSVEILSALPEGFLYETRPEQESIKIFISVPKDAVEGDYSFNAVFKGVKREDVVNLFFTVVSDALDVSPASTAETSVFVGSPAEFKLFFVNNTDSDAVFEVDPALPSNWVVDDLFAKSSLPLKITVTRRSSSQVSFFIYPRIQGSKEFNVNVAFENTSNDFAFRVNALPTLKSKFESPIHAFPFYSLSLIPAYFVQAFVSLFL
jgi:hypothetical protein